MNTTATTDLHFFLAKLLEPIISDILDTKFSEYEGKFSPNNTAIDQNRYEAGVKVACEVLDTKAQTIYQNIEKIPHKKIHGKLYFNRAELQEYIRPLS
jgi:hypothetical protein